MRCHLMNLSAAVVLFSGACFTTQAAESPITIQNDCLRVAFDPAQGRFTVRSTASDKLLVTGGRFAGTHGSAKVVSTADKTFGPGQSIELSYPDGNCDAILLFPKLPFALFRSTIANRTGEVRLLNRVPMISAGLELGPPAAQLKTLGTGGLTAPDRNLGSYGWLAVADPQTRKGVVAGWITHDRASGVVFAKIDAQQVRIEARGDYGRLRIAPGKTAQTETFALGLFDDARLGLEAWADAMARVYSIKLRPLPAGYCTWYSEKHGGASDEKHLAELTEYAAKTLKPYGFDFVQIDDGWQMGTGGKNGPKKNFTEFNPKGPYPGGMKAAADDVKRHGLVPGLWFMPFAGTHNDPWFAAHQDWFVKQEDGKPYDARWGGTSLDMTHSGAREYLRSIVQRIAKDWGYTYFKMDGMWTGTATKLTYPQSAYVEDGMGDAVFNNPDKTNIEAYRDGLKLIRETAGDGVFFLGCCAPQNMRSYAGAIGLVDAMRIGPDNGGSWSGWSGTSPIFGTRNYFLNGRIWWNDPDPLYVRTNIPTEQARAICSWAAVSGQLNACSEWLPDLPPQRLDLLRRTMPAHGRLARPVDLFDAEPARVWLVTDPVGSTRRDVLALFDWGPRESKDFDLLLARIGLPAAPSYALFDYWANVFLPPVGGRLKVSLPERTCQVLAVRPMQSHPQLLSTSRHITQGMVDVLAEEWDALKQELRGRSRVVGGDPYELRILAVAPDKTWRVEKAELSGNAAGAGVTIVARENNGCVRAVIESAASREVAWTIRFKSGPKSSRGPHAVINVKAETVTSDERVLDAVALTWPAKDGLVYEITDAAGRKSTACEGRWLDTHFTYGQANRYRITAVDWSGNRSEAKEFSTVVPKRPAPPPVPPKPTVSIAKLKPIETSNGYGQVRTGRSCDGNPLRVGGKAYADGMGVHAISRLVFSRKPEFKRFVAVAGLDEEMRNHDRSSVIFKVFSDSGQGPKGLRLLASSPILRFGKIEKWAFDEPIPKTCKRMVLVVDDAGDGYNSDHADWVDAGFVVENP